jgi:hypothetical protein
MFKAVFKFSILLLIIKVNRRLDPKSLVNSTAHQLISSAAYQLTSSAAYQFSAQIILIDPLPR